MAQLMQPGQVAPLVLHQGHLLLPNPRQVLHEPANGVRLRRPGAEEARGQALQGHQVVQQGNKTSAASQMSHPHQSLKVQVLSEKARRWNN